MGVNVVTNLSAPGVIGGSTPDAGTFTTLTFSPQSIARAVSGTDKARTRAASFEVSTSSSTPTTLVTIAGVANSVMDVAATVVAIKSDGAAHWKQDVEACFFADGAAVLGEMGADTTTTAKTNGTVAGLAVAIETDGGTNILVRVTGRAAETWRWGVDVTVVERTTAA